MTTYDLYLTIYNSLPQVFPNPSYPCYNICTQTYVLIIVDFSGGIRNTRGVD